LILLNFGGQSFESSVFVGANEIAISFEIWKIVELHFYWFLSCNSDCYFRTLGPLFHE